MARKSAGRGSYRFVFLTHHDDKFPFPPKLTHHDDNPFRNNKIWFRFRWLIQDLRMFGAWETLRKIHYLQIVWLRKGEKIYSGRDENGNTYWNSHQGCRGQGGRWMEAVDPHWFRGADFHAAPPAWEAWLRGMIAHTPEQIKARGEYGTHGRIGGTNPWSIGFYTGQIASHGIDPTYVPQTAVIFSPWYKTLKEAGFARWAINTSMPLYAPLVQPHDVKPEVVEEFYRGQAAYHRWSRGHDHDEWKN